MWQVESLQSSSPGLRRGDGDAGKPAMRLAATGKLLPF